MTRLMSILFCVSLFFSANFKVEAGLRESLIKGKDWLLRPKLMPKKVQDEARLYGRAMGVDIPDNDKKLKVYYNPFMSCAMLSRGVVGCYLRDGYGIKRGILVPKLLYTFLPSMRRAVIAHEVGHATDDFRGELKGSLFRIEYRAQKKAMLALYKVDDYKALELTLKRCFFPISHFIFKKVLRGKELPYLCGAASGFLELLKANPIDEKLKKILKKFEDKKAWQTYSAAVEYKKDVLHTLEDNLLPIK